MIGVSKVRDSVEVIGAVVGKSRRATVPISVKRDQKVALKERLIMEYRQSAGRRRSAHPRS